MGVGDLLPLVKIAYGNDNDTKSLAVAFILNFLMKRLNKNLAVKNGVQPLKMVLFAPIPSARETTTTARKPGSRRNWRTP